MSSTNVFGQYVLNSAGTIITQTGVSDLSGLSSITGVNVISSGNYNIYDIGNLFLKIDGVLTIDPTREMLLTNVDDAIEVRLGGTLNLGIERNLNNYNVNTPFTAIISTSTSNPWFGLNSGFLQVRGALNWNGASVKSHGNFYFYPTSKIVIRNAVFEASGTPISGRGYISWIDTDSITINGFRIIDGELLIKKGGGYFNGIVREHAKIALFANRINEVTFSNVSVGNNGNIIDFSIQSEGVTNGVVNIVNSASGTDLVMIGAESNVDNRNQGTNYVKKQIYFNLNDNNGGIDAVKCFIRDNDNGHRKDLNGHNNLEDKVYLTSTNNQGLTDTLIVTTGIVNVDGQNPRGQKNVFPYDIDFRGKTNSLGVDDFDIHFWSYNHQYLMVTTHLRGTGVLEVSNKLFVDKDVSEANQSIVDSYTEINNLDQLYDIAKSFKVRNENIEYPSIDKLMIDAVGEKLYLENINLVVDNNATSAFELDKPNNTITIKASVLKTGERFKSLETLGTLSLLNGSSIEFGYIANHITNKFIHLNWNENSSFNVSVENLDDNTLVLPVASINQEYKTHFIEPDPVPSSGIELQILTLDDIYKIYREKIPEDDLNFIRDNLFLEASESRQQEILFLTRKVLQKTQSLSYGQDQVALIDSSIVTLSNEAATSENQEAIIYFLKSILLKVSMLKTKSK